MEPYGTLAGLAHTFVVMSTILRKELPKRNRRATDLYEASPGCKKRKEQPPPEEPPLSGDDEAPAASEEAVTLSPRGKATTTTTSSKTKSTSKLPPGRGCSIQSIKHCRDTVLRQVKKDPKVLRLVSFFLLGSSTTSLKIEDLMEFSGYLAPIPVGVASHLIHQEDLPRETAMCRRGYRLTKPDLLRLIHLFGIQLPTPVETLTKDQMITMLCRFTSAPEATLCRTSGTASGGPTEYPPLSDNESTAPLSSSTKPPTKAQLQAWVKAYVRCFNMHKATMEHALDTAADKFGMDLSSRKDDFRRWITEEL